MYKLSYKVIPLSAFFGQPTSKAAPKIDFIELLTFEKQKTSPEFFNVMDFTLKYKNIHPNKKLINKFKQIGIILGQLLASKNKYKLTSLKVSYHLQNHFDQ